MDKETIRTMMKASRTQISEDERIRAAATLVPVMMEALASFNVLPDSQTLSIPNIIGLYVSYESEFPTLALEQALCARGARVAFPVCFSGGRMEFALEPESEIEGEPDSEPEGRQRGALRALLAKNPAHIFDEAEPELADLCLIDAHSLSALILPVVAFDSEGYRIGSGSGYYDRYLLRLKPGTPTLGIAYDTQQVAEFPHEAHDIPLTCILTPNNGKM